MARLIDYDSLLGKIHDTAEGLADCDQQNAAWALRKYAVRDIMDAETVDAVEVIRCRDCKFGTHFGDLEGEWINCRNLYGKPLMPFDGFCSYGERKEGAGNG